MLKPRILIPWILQTLMWIPVRATLLLFVNFKIEGLNNFRNISSPVIFSSNHTSEMDPIILTAALPFFSRFFPLFYTSREKSFYINSGLRQIFYGSTFFKIWGAYPVEVGKQDYSKSLKAHKEFIDKGLSICIFPEGGITKDGKLKEFKGGVAYLSESTCSPLIPVFISGAFRISFKEFFSRKRKITVTFGEPIYLKFDNEKHTSILDYYKMETERIKINTAKLSERPQDFI
ncbi:MAG: lysophospholipid acyltransferase family protein [bacterium]